MTGASPRPCKQKYCAACGTDLTDVDLDVTPDLPFPGGRLCTECQSEWEDYSS